MTAPALEIDDVSKRFGTRWALARLTYTLPAGRSLLLTGHNGSGKTTLLRMIATATFPTAGKLRVFGQDTRVARATLRHDIALVSHASYLYEDLSAAANLTLLAEFLGVEVKPTVPALLERVGLSARATSPVRQFSAGMRKRLALARLLLKKPRLALFDEPFGELDPSGIAWMESVLRELQADGVSIILATHLVDQGLSLTQERLHLVDGRRVDA